MKSAPPIAFDYRPSRLLVAATVAIAATAAVSPWLSSLPPGACAALSALVVGSASGALARFVRPAFVRISHGAAGWTLLDHERGEHPALLVGHRRLGSMLVLDWRHGQRAHFRAVFMPGNLDAETRRRLVLLLARGEPHAAPSQPLA
jgi:hypothetical protein